MRCEACDDARGALLVVYVADELAAFCPEADIGGSGLDGVRLRGFGRGLVSYCSRYA